MKTMSSVSPVIVLTLIGLCVRRVEAEQGINLDGQWTLTNANRSISVPAIVPGGVYTALMAADVIADPYFGANDVNYRWIALDNWTYSRKFDVSKGNLQAESIFLICDGLDTVSTITVNGHQIGQSSNMFLRYQFDLKGVVQEGTNTIAVAFQSAVTYALARWKAHASYDVPPDCPPDVLHGLCHANFVRKEQSSFAWDWGPGFAPQAIWKSIRVEMFDCAVIQDVSVTTTPYDSHIHWAINVTVYFKLGSSAAPCQGLLVAQLKELNVSLRSEVSLTNQRASFFFFSPVDKAETWWPAGYGAQPLYDLHVTYQSHHASKITSAKSLKVGFRFVELVQEPIPQSPGLSFYFRINRRPVFIKGANWIPADAFQERVDRDRLESLLGSLVAANMHATRVWGGGVYEQDAFYEICDRLGILVWQDVQFACAMYPTDPAFLATVSEEVTQQVRRLSSHPSVIAWSANNENEVALRQNWYGTAKNFSLYRADFVKLYVDTVLTTLRADNANLIAVSSSPSNGPETDKEGWVAKDPTDPHYGDVHYYNYKDDCWDAGIYPKPRFASEYGFQSWPSFETLRPVSKEQDWSQNSSFAKHRQHHPGGKEQMMAQIKRHFKESASKNSTQQFIDMIYLTQISQALCYKFETEHYRRLQSCLVGGEGMTMGAVYWQLNDVWQAPSWASIEYGGKWKMLHYFAKDFFAPLLASGVEDDEGTLSVFVISDVHAIVSAELNVTVWSWDSQTPLSSVIKTFAQKAQSAQPVLVQPTANIFPKQCSRLSCYLTLQVISTNPPLVSPVNPHFLSSFSAAQGLKPANIKFAISKGTGNTFNILLASDATAPFVWLEMRGIRGRFSNNGFLMNQRTRSEVFYAWETTTVNALKKALTVSSLMDIYNTEPRPYCD